MHPPELRQPKAPEQHRYHFLDAMRGLAAVFVVPQHSPAQLGWGRAASSSYLAVDFFFCLSGFVVALSYGERLATTLSFRDFALTRAIRLYPTAFLGTVLGALFLLRDHSQLLWRSLPLPAAISYAIISGLLILPLPRGILFPLDLPMWTLFLELVANFVYGLLARLRLASTALLTVIAALSFVALSLDRIRNGDIGAGFTSYSALLGIHRVCFSFFVGILLYRLYQRRRPARLHGPQAFAVAGLGAAFLVALFVTPRPLLHSTGADLLSVGIGFPLLVYWGARVQLPSFTTKAFAALGALSYPLYILHVPLLEPLSWIHLSSVPLMQGVGLAYVLAIILITWFIAQYYDVPVRRAIVRKLRA